jgi:hypothetical protein
MPPLGAANVQLAGREVDVIPTQRHNWDDDQFCLGVEGGYWPRGV